MDVNLPLGCRVHMAQYRYAPHNDGSVNDGQHTRRWSHKITILYYNIILTIVLQLPTVFSTVAGSSGRAVYGVGLRPLACWDCGFESHRGHGCLSVVSVVCCQVEVSATR